MPHSLQVIIMKWLERFDRFIMQFLRFRMADKRRFAPGIVPPEVRSEPAWWFVFQENKLLVEGGPSGVNLPCLIHMTALGLAPLRERYLGRLDHRPCYAVEVAEGATPRVGMAFDG